jgi:cytochrome c oxidase cbb3-type subunit 3
MPPFPTLGDADLNGIVAFIHDQKTRAESVEGGRQSVSAEDVQSGDIAAGRRYFESKCTECHDADGDLSGIASRMNGLNLMRRMLVPSGGRGNASGTTPRVMITTTDNQRYIGQLSYQDEFVIALTDADGRYRSFSTRSVEFDIEDPLARHIELLGEYTDKDMHDVLTYLHTLQ